MRTTILLCLAMLAHAAWGSCAKAAQAGADQAAELRLVGALRDQSAAWAAYKSRFVSETGRVIDTANGNISHSEGQGYGMLLAVAAGDRDAFEKIWSWTRANLMVRDDALFAWRWEPNKRPGVADTNNATDGDLLIAWALTEAADAWDDRAYAVAARRTAVEVGRKLILPDGPGGSLLLPGVWGFSAQDRADGPVVNLSYLVFPAFARLPRAAPEFDWAKLGRDGQRLLGKARFGSQHLPVEWTALGGPQPAPAANFPPVYGYNAVRIPLYLAWAGQRADLHPTDQQTPDKGALGGATLAEIDVAGNRTVSTSREAGYAAITSLDRCALAGTPLPPSLRRPQVADSYYSVTLHMLALAAAQMRYPACLRG